MRRTTLGSAIALVMVLGSFAIGLPAGAEGNGASGNGSGAVTTPIAGGPVSYGPVTVDGQLNEWQTTSVFYGLFNAGNPDSTASNYQLLGNSYLRYDCGASPRMLYVRVASAAPYSVFMDSNSWVTLNGDNSTKVDGLHVAGRPFAWVNPNPATNTADGYEAGFPLPAGTSTIQIGVHTESTYKGGATAGTPGTASNAQPLMFTVDCTGYVPPTNKVSVSASASGRYDLQHTWSIEKTSTSPAVIYADADEDVDLGYEIAVAEGASSVKHAAVTGSVHVGNTAATAQSFALAVPSGCTVAANAATTVPANGAVDVAFTCTAPDVASADLLPQSVSVTVDGKQTPASIAWTKHDVDAQPTITDSFDGGDDVTVAAGSYSQTVTADGQACVQHTNVATLHGQSGVLDTSDVVTNTVCPTPTISVTGSGSYDVEHHWTIDKATSDPDVVLGAGGSTVDLHYSVDAVETGSTTTSRRRSSPARRRSRSPARTPTTPRCPMPSS